MTRYGYACVLQQVRGQMDSGGEWEPIIHERDDGLDTLAWLVKQPFVDGNIGMRGPSYLTCTQWAMADVLPPEVKTLMPSVFGTDLRKVFYERGLLRDDILTAWATLMPGRGMRQTAGNDYLAAGAHRPAHRRRREVHDEEGGLVPRRRWSGLAVFAVLADASRCASSATIPEHTKIPLLFVGAFFDPFFQAQRDTWDRLASREQSVFVIGPWNHLGLTSGDYDFAAAPGRFDQWPLMLEWFDHTLKGQPLITLKPGTVQTFGVGDTKFNVHAQWPDPSIPLTTYELGSAAQSNSCDGGVLSATPTPAETTGFRFDPANPVPTKGGASLLSFAFFRTLGFTPGPVEQGESCARDDVLTFRSEPVSTATRLSGAGSAHAHRVLQRARHCVRGPVDRRARRQGAVGARRRGHPRLPERADARAAEHRARDAGGDRHRLLAHRVGAARGRTVARRRHLVELPGAARALEPRGPVGAGDRLRRGRADAVTG